MKFFEDTQRYGLLLGAILSSNYNLYEHYTKWDLSEQNTQILVNLRLKLHQIDSILSNMGYYALKSGHPASVAWVVYQNVNLNLSEVVSLLLEEKNLAITQYFIARNAKISQWYLLDETLKICTVVHFAAILPILDIAQAIEAICVFTKDERRRDLIDVVFLAHPVIDLHQSILSGMFITRDEGVYKHVMNYASVQNHLTFYGCKGNNLKMVEKGLHLRQDAKSLAKNDQRNCFTLAADTEIKERFDIHRIAIGNALDAENTDNVKLLIDYS